jgi:hypothetical protein
MKNAPHYNNMIVYKYMLTKPIIIKKIDIYLVNRYILYLNKY